MTCDIISRLQYDTHELCHVEGVVGKLWMVPEGWMVTLGEARGRHRSNTEHREAQQHGMSWVSDGWCGTLPYLVLWEHFAHLLPSHISNTPQSSQISIAALILTVISGRDRCTHFTAQGISQSWRCAPKCSNKTFSSAQLSSAQLGSAQFGSAQLLHSGRPGIINASLIRHYFTVKR